MSLAQALAAGAVAGGMPAAAEQGGAPNPAEEQVTCSQQGPVNCGTGEAWRQFTDLVVPGLGLPLSMTRTYDSGSAGADSPFGYGWSFSYGMSLAQDGSGNATVRQENGSAITFTKTSSGGYVAPPRVMAALASSGAGFTLTRFRGREQYGFSQSGQLAWEADANGDVTRLAYSGGLLSSVTSPSGRTLRFAYSGAHVAKMIDPVGRAELFGYDGAGNLVSTISPDGDQWQFGYDAGHLLTSVTDPRGLVTTIRYDASGRVVAAQYPDGATTTWSYTGNGTAPQGGTTTVSIADQGTTTYDYSGLELLVVTYGTGTAQAATTSYTYDAGGRITSQAGPDLQVTRFSYDAHGNMLTSVDPLGRATAYAYNQLDEVSAVVQPGGSAARFSYDRRGNLIRATDPLGRVTTYVYNPASPSEIASVTGTGGHRVAFSYDAHGDVTAMSTSPRSGVTETTAYAYNGYDELACQASPAATARNVTCPPPGSRYRTGTTSYTYNWAGQTTSVTDPAGHLTTMRYDHDGNLIAVTGPGATTTYSYNSQNQRTTTDVNGTRTATAAYNQAGSLTVQAGPAGNATRYSYDLFGHLIGVTDPLGRPTTYGYDRSGNETSMTDPSGNVTTYAHDAAGQLTAVAYGQGSAPAVTYTYAPDGQRASMTDQTGTSSYTYDPGGRLTSSSHTTSAGATLAYSYAYHDARDQVTLTYPDGQHSTSSYDSAGQLTSVRDWLGDTVTFGYDPNGNLATETLPGGIKVTYTGTAIAVSRGGQALAGFTYAMNSAGRITSAGSTGVPGGSAKPAGISYTGLGQLASAGAYTYGYNTAGQLRVLPSGASRAFDIAGEMLEQFPKPTTTGAASAATIYAYDKQGNRVAVNPPNGSTADLTYTQANQLAGYTDGPTSATYTYDGDGLRMTKTVNGATSDFTWDLAAATPLLLADSATSYIYGPGGQPVEQITHGTPAFLVGDRQGSTRLLASKAGKIIGSYSYGPYGTTTSHTGPVATFLQYDGQFTDAETGYIYLRARYYDPATAQFLTPDPAVALTGMPYGYAGNDPVNAADPTGLSWWNPFSWSPKTWSVIGWIAVGVGAVGFIAATVLTGGADLPLLGTVGGVAGEAAATDAEAAVVGAVAGTAASDAAAAGEGAALGTLTAAIVDPSASSPVQTALQIIGYLRAAARWAGLTADTATAAQTCSNPNQSTVSCVTSVAFAVGSAWDVAHHYLPRRPAPLGPTGEMQPATPGSM